MSSNPTKKELKEITDFTLDVAKKAGEKLVSYQRKLSALKVSAKEAQGVVSKADIETEKFIIRQLRRKFPKFAILGEESSFSELSTAKQYQTFLDSSEFTWIIDPLDGTTNFLTGLDYFAVCIALYYKGEVILGVVHRPQTQESYLAFKGGGAWKIKNSKKRKIQGPAVKKLADCVLATGFSSEKGTLINQEFRIFKSMMSSCRGIRRMGSAALDMCLVADGQFSGFWERGLAPWDIAASGRICEEAGIVLSTWKGERFTPVIETIMGTERKIIKEFRQILLKS